MTISAIDPRIMSAMTDLQNESTDDNRYLALKARDSRFDGIFFTGVTSTGIYCRPVCRVRTPKRENCRFFSQPAQAERPAFDPVCAAGPSSLRACRRPA